MARALVPLTTLAIFCFACCAAQSSSVVSPFTRPLQQGDRGRDVILLQSFLRRTPTSPNLNTSGIFTSDTTKALSAFQSAVALPATGVMDGPTSAAVVSDLLPDRYTDVPSFPLQSPYLFKIVIPISRNRSTETVGTIFAANGTAVAFFPARLHGNSNSNPPSWCPSADSPSAAASASFPAPPGVDICSCSNDWPSWSACDAVSSFASNGATPTGLAEVDLNAPETIPRLYGPYPIVRIVTGLVGNLEVAVPTFRDGLLLHTGQWPGWAPPYAMPNSAGCIHTWPDAQAALVRALVSLGVAVHPNTGGGRPYPYATQGLVSIYEL